MRAPRQLARAIDEAALGEHLGGKGHGLLHGDEAGIRQHVHDRLDDLLAVGTDIERRVHVYLEGTASAAVPFAVSAETVASSRVLRSRCGRAKTSP
jgi:hypothetical protein